MVNNHLFGGLLEMCKHVISGLQLYRATVVFKAVLRLQQTCIHAVIVCNSGGIEPSVSGQQVKIVVGRQQRSALKVNPRVLCS
jgi:hypothetical protein